MRFAFSQTASSSYHSPVLENQTTEKELVYGAYGRPPVPGLALVWAQGRATCRTFDAREPLVFGRVGPPAIDDRRMSRQHVEVVWRDGRWHVRDLGSRNGTFVDGVQVTEGIFDSPSQLRAGGALFLFEADILRFDGREDLREGDSVVGAVILGAKRETIAAAEAEESLLVMGESGTGKERLARWYHHLGPRVRSPYLVQNCANLPTTLAEALLFGAERGVHSMATSNTLGLFREAHGGVLFLDEVAELSMDVQAKLLRVVEDKVVAPLGSTTPRPADVCIVSATNANLNEAIRAGRFRHDLLPRLGQRRVCLPPLRERREEIPFLVQLVLSEIKGGALPPSVRFIEACLLRSWLLNVRELFLAVKHAAAVGRTTPNATELEPEMLPPPMVVPEAPAVSVAGGAPAAMPESLAESRRDDLLAALKKHGNNVRATAEALGIGRTTLYEMLKRFGIKVK
jgi:transcriptional regulator with AAA-type ATPase domain